MGPTALSGWGPGSYGPVVEPTIVERASGQDLVSLAADVGEAPMQVGAVLWLDGPPPPLADLRAAVGERTWAVPRLRQRLEPTPPACGRPIWVDDAAFSIAAHVGERRCTAPGGEAEVLAVAAEQVGTRLPRDRPLWRLDLVTGLAGGGAALVVVFHHVLADGIGGLAVLAALVDGAPPASPDPAFPRAAPSRRTLALDAARCRLAALGRLPAALGRVRTALAQLRSGSGERAARCSLNRPTGARRRFVVVRTDLEAVHERARAHQATVNDVVLGAVAGALHRLLLDRGEQVDRFVVSVPVSGRAEADAETLGNQVGVVPVELPGAGPPDERLAVVAAATRRAKQGTRAASGAVLDPLFRVLARLGAFQWFVDHQRRVHTFTTNLRGPDRRLALLDRPILDVAPLAVVTGNVTVSFAVLSYAGRLVVTVIADPDACPDLDRLAALVDEELERSPVTPDAPRPA